MYPWFLFFSFRNPVRGVGFVHVGFSFSLRRFFVFFVPKPGPWLRLRARRFFVFFVLLPGQFEGTMQRRRRGRVPERKTSMDGASPRGSQTLSLQGTLRQKVDKSGTLSDFMQVPARCAPGGVRPQGAARRVHRVTRRVRPQGAPPGCARGAHAVRTQGAARRAGARKVRTRRGAPAGCARRVRTQGAARRVHMVRAQGAHPGCARGAHAGCCTQGTQGAHAGCVTEGTRGVHAGVRTQCAHAGCAPRVRPRCARRVRSPPFRCLPSPLPFPAERCDAARGGRRNATAARARCSPARFLLLAFWGASVLRARFRAHAPSSHHPCIFTVFANSRVFPIFGGFPSVLRIARFAAVRFWKFGQLQNKRNKRRLKSQFSTNFGHHASSAARENAACKRRFALQLHGSPLDASATPFVGSTKIVQTFAFSPDDFFFVLNFFACVRNFPRIFVFPSKKIRRKWKTLQKKSWTKNEKSRLRGYNIYTC